jgi:epoxyqueuosine reductase QueG
MNLADELDALLKANGADIVGFADLGKIAPETREGLPIGVSIGIALNPQVISEIQDGPTRRYYDEYERANTLLDTLGNQATQFIKDQGHQARWFAATNADIDPATLSTHLPHKTAATQAGLGWIGKCALLVTKQFGSAIRITTVLTDAELPANEPISKSLCGNCTACVDACPGNALTGNDWQAGLQRDSLYDAFVCRETALKIAATRTGIRVTLCGMCINVCPWTQQYIARSG